jgi:hypothetical protein
VGDMDKDLRELSKKGELTQDGLRRRRFAHGSGTHSARLSRVLACAVAPLRLEYTSSLLIGWC